MNISQTCKMGIIFLLTSHVTIWLHEYMYIYKYLKYFPTRRVYSIRIRYYLFLSHLFLANQFITFKVPFEIKKCLILGRKVMTNLDSIFKSRDITLSTKVQLVKAMVFPVVMYGYESWTIKKAEHRRIDAFEPRCWRRLLRVPWTARRSNQSILKEISPEYSLEGPLLNLKLQYFGHLMWITDSLEKTDAGKD